MSTPQLSKTNVPVRRLLDFDSADITNRLKVSLPIHYEDGVVCLKTPHEIIVDRYLYEVFKVVPKLKITSKHSITNFYSEEKVYTSDSLHEFFRTIFKDTVDAYVKPTQDRLILESVFKEMFLVVESIYSNLGINKLEYASTLNILHFLEIQFDKKMIEAIIKTANDPTIANIQNSYRVLEEVIKSPTVLKTNPLAKSYAGKFVNRGQVEQMLGNRGHTADIDGSIYKKPIISSFTLGLYKMTEMIMESRPGTHALDVANGTIAQSEYGARELQEVAMTLPRLVDGDCGNNDYMDWYVRDNGAKTDLPNLVGQWYLNDDGVEELITSKHKHLVGKNIKLRSAMRCKHHDKGAICTKCFGELSYSIFNHTLFGHIIVTYITEKLTQGLLSKKHNSESANGNEIKLELEVAKYLDVINKTEIAFKPGVLNQPNKEYRIIVTQRAAFGLSFLNSNSDLDKIAPERISRIDSCVLAEIDLKTNAVKYTFIQLKHGSTHAHFTTSFVRYLLDRKNWEYDTAGDIVISLTGWSDSATFVAMPQVEYSFADIQKGLQELFKRKSKDVDASQEMILQQLFDLLNVKLNINIAILQVLVYIFSVRKEDFGISRGAENISIMNIETILNASSCGGKLAHERIERYMIKPSTIYVGDEHLTQRRALGHPLDGNLMPAEVMAYVKECKKLGKLTNYPSNRKANY